MIQLDEELMKKLLILNQNQNSQSNDGSFSCYIK